MAESLLEADLLAALRRAIPIGSSIATLSNGNPNRITDISQHGVTIETERSLRLGKEPQLVPAWMIEVAWTPLVDKGALTNKELLSRDGLNVKRSSAVCALLARLPDVHVESTRPIVLKRDQTEV